MISDTMTEERVETARSGVLFLCVANSARSQMAEGLARKMAPAGLPIASAGSEPRQVHPMAVAAMLEVGVDISGSRSKGIAEVDLESIGTAITLCAEESCPVDDVPVRLHWPVDDPAGVAEPEHQLAEFRRIRDLIAARLGRHFGWSR